MILNSVDTDGMRASESRHAVEHARTNRNLGCLGVNFARPQAGTGERLEPVHQVLHQRAPVVAASLLPFAPAGLGNGVDGSVAPTSGWPRLRACAADALHIPSSIHIVTSPLAISPALYCAQFLTRYVALGSACLWVSLRMFPAKIENLRRNPVCLQRYRHVVARKRQHGLTTTLIYATTPQRSAGQRPSTERVSTGLAIDAGLENSLCPEGRRHRDQRS